MNLETSPARTFSPALAAPVAARRRTLRACFGVALIAWLAASALAAETWVTSWATAPVSVAPKPTDPSLQGVTLRQVARVTLGGERCRVKLSNAFGTQPLVLNGASVALAQHDGAIAAESSRSLTFGGSLTVSIPPGASMLSDPVDLNVKPLTDLAVSLWIAQTPEALTTHVGARANSYLVPGDAQTEATLPQATRITQWHFLSGIEVATSEPAGATVFFGDSITDGFGCTIDGHDRWTDVLARRVFAAADITPFALLNLGIGGNRLLRDGFGPNALARFDRDVLGQAGVRQVVVFLGINDIGTRVAARRKGEAYASPAEMIGAYQQIVARARAHGLRVIGATLAPFRDTKNYWSPDGDEDRKVVNAWIREPGNFDAIIDFDALLRDPADPDRLLPEYDSGDRLHPSLAGYARMGGAIDLRLFTP